MMNFPCAQGELTPKSEVESSRNSNSSKLIWLSSLPAEMKRSIQNECAEVVTSFLPLKVYEDFYRCSRAANSPVLGWIWPKFDLIQAYMIILNNCNTEEDPTKKKYVLEWSQYYTSIFQTLNGS